MTLDELVKLYNDAAAHEYEVFLESGGFGASTLDVGLNMKRAGIRAVVEALRDEIEPLSWQGSIRLGDVSATFIEILASDGVEAAGGSTSNASKAIGEGGALSAPGTPTPAAAPVCEWTGAPGNWVRGCNQTISEWGSTYPPHVCSQCGLLISIKSEAAR